jgi:hypothetical protein
VKLENLRDVTIEVQLAPWRSGVEVYIGALDLPRSKRYVAKELEFNELELGSTCVPLFELSMKDAQHLMDNLWFCGLRPSEGTGSAGSLKATQSHLEDMRKIAFHFLELKENTE